MAINEHHTVADMIAEMNPGYLSLAGAQDKFPAIFDGHNFYLPTKGEPTTHIVKVPIQHSGIKESVYNEYYCMELARAIGLPVPPTCIVAGQHPLLVIERYDRYADEKGIIHRIHQQDFCQAHGFTSEFKYEDKGGPTLKQNYDLILENMAAREKLSSIQLFLDWIGFNLIIGNHDSHSKNISFLLKAGGYQLAPLYDLICTSIYPKLKTSFSFKIGDRADFSKIGQNQIALLEKQLGLRPGVFSTRLSRIVKEVLAKKDIQAKNLATLYAEAKIPQRISKLIDDRVKGLQMQGLDFSRAQ